MALHLTQKNLPCFYGVILQKTEVLLKMCQIWVSVVFHSVYCLTGCCADDFLQDIPCGFGPDKGVGIRIVMDDVAIHSLSKFGYSGEYAAS